MVEASFTCQHCKCRLVLQPGEQEGLRLSGSGSGLSAKLEESFMLLEEAAAGGRSQGAAGGGRESGGGGSTGEGPNLAGCAQLAGPSVLGKVGIFLGRSRRQLS